MRHLMGGEWQKAVANQGVVAAAAQKVASQPGKPRAGPSSFSTRAFPPFLGHAPSEASLV